MKEGAKTNVVRSSYFSRLLSPWVQGIRLRSDMKEKDE